MTDVNNNNQQGHGTFVPNRLGGMTNEEFEQLVEYVAERAAKKAAIPAAEHALNVVYQYVGKGALRAILWALGIACVSLLAWLGAKGQLKIP